MKTPSSSLSRTVGIALFAVAIVSQFAPTDAFMEDICINPTVGGFRNLYQLAFNAGCKVGQVTQGCVQAVLAPGLFPPACCMGSIHHLTTYMLAQTQGLKSDLAFQLALYNSAIDPPSLTLCDACGMPIAERYNAPSMLGISRLNINTGGILMHQPATWMGHLGNGLNPDVHNHETEGYIASYRDWAFSTAEDEEVHGASHYATHHDACVYGYTVPGVNYNPFSGEVCQNSGYINATIPIMIMPNGVDMTAAQVTALWTTNPQAIAMVRYITDAINPFGDMPIDPDSEYTLNTMSSWLAANPTFSLRDNNQTVPIGIARFGIYLHLLGDRLSHYYCSDAPGSTMTLVSDNPPVYALKFSPLACNIPVHILQHFWEVGHSYNVPQTAAAISIMWSEISTWTVEMRERNPSWFRASRTDLTGEVLTALNQMMTITDAQLRMQFFLDKLDEFKFDTFPGFDDYSTECPTA